MTIKHSLKEIRTWLRTLEENKWRKRYKVDAKRVTYFTNNGVNSSLPESLSRKGDNWTYVRERRLAKEYLKKIREDKKLAVNEDNLSILLKKELVKAIKEEESDAAKKAKALGLVSKGYGNWADPKTDKVVAQTKDGKLVPMSASDNEPKIGNTKQSDDSEPEDKPFGGDTGTDADFGGEPPEGSREPDDSGEAIPAKDLANDPETNNPFGTPDSRGTSWDASYRGAEDSKEWEDDYEEAQEDGDEEKLKQIQWFGEKQGWGDNGEFKENISNKSVPSFAKMYQKIKTNRR